MKSEQERKAGPTSHQQRRFVLSRLLHTGIPVLQHAIMHNDRCDDDEAFLAVPVEELRTKNKSKIN